MGPVEFFLLTIAGIFVVGVAGEALFTRTGIPDVLWLVAVGLLLGPVTGLAPRHRLEEVAPYFAALTLVVILFDGGRRLRWRDLASAAPRSVLLATATFATATAAVAAASMLGAEIGLLPDGWTWTHGLLLGTILGGSSSIVVMPAMARAGVRTEVANLLSLESAFTDALCVVGATAVLRYLTSSANGSPFLMLLQALIIGMAIGAAAGWAWSHALRHLNGGQHAYPLTLAALLGLYVAVAQLQGSAALAVLAFAVVVGNSGVLPGADAADPGPVHEVHGQVAFIAKSFFFTFIGAMLSPPWASITFGVTLAAVLLVVRWPTVRLVTMGADVSRGDRRTITVSFPRGLAAGVLATLPAANGVAATGTLTSVVFAAVVATILVFSVGLPLAGQTPVTSPETVTGEDGNG